MRFLEGLSTGTMLGSYILKQRSLLDYLLNTIIAHWFFSFWFHMTYSISIYEMDTLLIHMLIIERAFKCFPEVGIFFQILFLIRNEKYGYLYNVLVAFLGTYLCGPVKNQISIFSPYMSSIVIAGVFYIMNYVFYLKGFKKTSSYSIIIYHLFLGLNAYYELPFYKFTENSWLVMILRILVWIKFLYYFHKNVVINS